MLKMTLELFFILSQKDKKSESKKKKEAIHGKEEAEATHPNLHDICCDYEDDHIGLWEPFPNNLFHYCANWEELSNC